jgi:hypothetical protein
MAAVSVSASGTWGRVGGCGWLRLEGDRAEIREPDLRSAAITRAACHGHGPGQRRDQSPRKAPRGLLSRPLSRSLAVCSGGAFTLTR